MRHVVIAKDKGSNYPLMFWSYKDFAEACYQFRRVPACDWVQLFEETDVGLKFVGIRTGPGDMEVDGEV